MLPTCVFVSKCSSQPVNTLCRACLGPGGGGAFGVLHLIWKQINRGARRPSQQLIQCSCGAAVQCCLSSFLLEAMDAAKL